MKSLSCPVPVVSWGFLLLLCATIPVFGQTPTVSISEPTDNQVYASTDLVIFKTFVSDPFGGGARVDFFLQNTFIGSTNVPPYSFPFPGLEPGAYSLFASVTDVNNRTNRSQTVAFEVNAPPTISISTDQTNFFAQGEVMISAEVIDDQELLTNTVVRFYADAELIGTALTPFEIVWTNLMAGTFALTAEVTDRDEESATSDPVTIVVHPNPVASITSPVDGIGVLPGTEVTIVVEATNVFGNAITNVIVLEGANVIGSDTSAPFTVTWSNALIGSHVITAQAMDDRGDVATAEKITINTVNAVIRSPANGSFFFTNQAIMVEAEGVPDGLTNVVLFQGTNTLVQTDSPPFTATVTNHTAGVVQIGVTATDTEGRTTTNTVSVSILDELPSSVGTVTTNYGIGLLVQTVSISNPTSQDVSAARVLIRNLPANVLVYNVSGTNDGVIYVQYNQSIPAGTTAELDIEYYVPDLRPPNPTLEVVLAALEPVEVVTGLEVSTITEAYFEGRLFYLEFQADPGNVYYVQYATNMASPDWHTAKPAIQTRRSNPVLWFDSGPPRTERPADTNAMRFYRVIRVAP